MKSLRVKYNCEKPDKKRLEEEALSLMKHCIDVRLFGGISTEKDAAVNITGPVQFALLNPSMNKIDLRIHQNTSVFSSSAISQEAQLVRQQWCLMLLIRFTVGLILIRQRIAG